MDWGSGTVVRICDSPQGGVAGMRKVCLWMKKCVGVMGEI